MTITFVGHSFVPSYDKVKEEIKQEIRKNTIGIKHVTCYVGGYGDFDEICASACRELKREYDDIQIVYVTPYISLSEQAKIKEMQRYGLCDTLLYPPIENYIHFYNTRRYQKRLNYMTPCEYYFATAA